jgi:UDP-N-acetylglucosamine 2-epimerase (non-hydrolysing)
MMKTVLCIFGTRPEAIKLAPVIQELRRRPQAFTCRVCVTAQHREMLDQVLRLFAIDPDYDLDLMREDQSPIQVAAAALTGIEPILRQEHPDWVLIQGDTTTAAAAALAGAFAGSRVAHVEAGLRSFDRRQPFPEEINRRIAGVVADLHFAPTETARANLLREGVASATIHVTGNTVIDALQWTAAQPCDLSQILRNGRAEVPSRTRLLLVTAHRRENLGEGMASICSAIRTLATRHAQDLHILFPVHRNPHVQQPVRQWLAGIPNISLLDPLDYLPLVHVMKRSYLILTDSGGIQEEAPTLGVPVLVMREVTERPEAVAAGTARLVGTGTEQIVAEAETLLADETAHRAMARAGNPYGDGRAARRIADILESHD